MKRAVHPAAAAQGGWSMFETMVAIGIIATGLMVLVQQMSISFRESNANDHRAFAYQKAAALLGEVQNAIALGRIKTSDELYALVDPAPNVVLTTRTDADGVMFAPDHPMSGNVQRREQWLWSRRIEVQPQETPGLYYCRVHVLLHGDDNQWRTEATHAQQFSLLPSAESPEQVHDVYLLACGETPSLWSDLAELKSQFETARNSILGRSQVQMRLHWITRLGFGRDPCYAPSVNTARTADQSAPAAYWLPGALGAADIGSFLYRSELLGGMHRTELGLVNGTTRGGAVPFSIADQHNHCLRTPAAWRLFDQRVAAGLDRADEPPLQLLYDDMARRPDAYRNAIVVNLHGRGLPTPPLRNYSDAAKDPVGRPGFRAVTHPARLWTPRDVDGDGNHADTTAVELRVYGYRTESTALDVLKEPITLQIFGPDLTGQINAGSASTLLVDRLVGGVDTATGRTSTSVAYAPFAAAPTAAAKACDMWFEAGFVGGAQPYTWVRLHNTPVVAPAVGTRGLAVNARLYGLEYVPSPVSGEFQQDLATDSSSLLMRNTARWRLRIPPSVFTNGLLSNSDHVVRVVTRIGSDLKTGQRWPTPFQPWNSSETWTWWSQAPTAVPVTERAQFLGDPRACPYADLAAGANGFPQGYNWNFDDLRAGPVDARPLWPCLSSARLRDGFADGARADAPRLLQLLREALQTTRSTLVSPVDRLAQTLLLGGEIARPTPTGTSGVTLHSEFTGGSESTVDSITFNLVLQRNAPATWWYKPWLGELFPDDLGSAFATTGNLPLGSAQLQWRRQQSNALPSLPYGTSFDAPVSSVLGAFGAPALLSHVDADKKGLVIGDPVVGLQTADAAVEAINAATHVVPPGSLSGARVLALAETLASPPPALTATDVFPTSTTALLETTWHNSAGTTGAIAAWSGPVDTAFLALWTAEPSALTAREVAVQTLLLGLRTFHVGGHPDLPQRITELPLVQIIEPQNGSSRLDAESMTVRWQTTWTRFDGQRYTTTWPTPWNPGESDLLYRVQWSGDGGATWTSALTGQPTAIGAWPESVLERLADAGTGNESFTFNLPSLPPGEYLFRLEAWRVSTRQHCSSHYVRVFIRSPS